MARTRKKQKSPPQIGCAAGPDAKGRSYLELPSGKRLLFYGGVAGETVRVRRGRRGRRGEQGDLLEVLEPSHLRREARCIHFGVCGGCTLQHIPEDQALALKSEPIYKMLQNRVPEVELWTPVGSPEEFGYRTKVELSFLGDSLGFHRRGRFDRLVDVQRCWLTRLRPALLQDLRSWRDRHGFRGWDPYDHAGDLRYLLYRRVSSGEQDLAALVVDARLQLTGAQRNQLIEIFQRHEVSGAVLLRQSSTAGAVVPDSEEPLYGPQVLQEQLGHLTFELGWRSFYQVNPRSYRRLLDTVREWRTTPAGGRILDLFCGVGSIGLYLLQEGDRLTGVEMVEQAVLDARSNARRNGIEARFEVREAESWSELEAELLILDPPRSGCHPKLVKLLKERAPAPELFYISCNPHRLLDELDDLLVNYRLRRVQAFDFFPQTHHLELLLQFEAR